MTDEELKALVAENSRTIAENSRAIRVLRENFEMHRQESERNWQQFQEELRVSKEESERIWQVLASRKEHDRTIRSLHREYGCLGNAIGGYTESLLRPPLKRLLRERFGMKYFHAPLSLQGAGEELEIDLVGHAMDAIPEVYIVEIKSKLQPADFDQLFEHLRKLPRAVPEHRGKKLFGMLAALEIHDQLRVRAMREGIYLAKVKDDIVDLTSPDDFEPHAFGLRSLG